MLRYSAELWLEWQVSQLRYSVLAAKIIAAALRVTVSMILHACPAVYSTKQSDMQLKMPSFQDW